MQVLTFERLPAPSPLHSAGVLPPLPAVPKGHPFPALAALSRLEVSPCFAHAAALSLLWACRPVTPRFTGPNYAISTPHSCLSAAASCFYA